jgi:hypothetical protein
MRRLLGVGFGAALMFLLDPNQGGRRRALLRDKAVRLWTRGSRQVGGLSEDLGNRARGVLSETKSRLRREETPPDAVLEARVRSEIGHVVSHPRAIDVRASNGRVTISGPVLASEVDALLGRVAGVRGVTDVENRLEVHEHPDGIPGLQGESSPLTSEPL